MKVWIRKKIKGIIAASLGVIILMSMALWVAFNSKIDADSTATYIQDVKEALAAAEGAGTEIRVPYEASELTSDTYSIYTPADWMALMVLSYDNDLSGYTFYIQSYEEEYNLRSVTLGDKTFDFRGISLNEDYPFKGTIASTLGGTGIMLRLSAPLFGYLDAAGAINVSSDKDVVISLDVKNASSGLAQVLTGSGTVDNTTIKNILLSGTVKNTSGYAGGIFGEVRGPVTSERLVIDSLGVSTSVSSVSGVCTGSIVGKVSGNVQIAIDKGLWQDNMTVAYTPETDISENAVINHSVGIVFGEVEGISDEIQTRITLTDEVTIGNSIQAGAMYTGGVIGKAKYCTLDIEGALTVQGAGTLDISSNADVSGDTYSGGLIGSMENVTLKGSLDTTRGMVLYTQGDAAYIGGIAGYMKDCNVTLPTVSLVSNYTSSHTAGGLVGESDNISVTAASVSVADAFSIEGNALYAGGIIGKDTASTYTITSMLYNDKVLKVTSGANNCCLGGFAGELTDTLLDVDSGITTSGMVLTATSTTSLADKAICIGGIIGKYTNNRDEDVILSDYEVSNLSIKLSAADYHSCLGGIIGAIDQGTGTGKVNVTDCTVYILSAVGKEAKTYVGGMVGGNYAEGTKINDVSILFSEKGWSIAGYAAGGVLGCARADCEIADVWDMTLSKSVTVGETKRLGGVIGVIDSNVFASVTNVSFGVNSYLTSGWGASRYLGGIVGETLAGSVLELNGTIDLTNLGHSYGNNLVGYYAAIVGSQTNSLLYVNPVSYSAETGYVYGLTIPYERYEDEVGNYGSVYRNGNWDTQPAADLSDSAQWVITKTDGRVKVRTDEDPYTLATAGDCMRLSIAMNSEDTFTGFGESVISSDLLKGDYTLTASIDISHTGIQTLNKNVKNNYPFTGSIKGTAGAGYVIKNVITVAHQGYLGLFSALGDGAEFSDMGLNMSITYCNYETDNIHETGSGYVGCISYNVISQQHAGGFAAYGTGNITFRNIELRTSITEDRNMVMESYAIKDRYFGGAIGQYVAKKDSTLTMEGVNASVDVLISEKNHYAGGLVGYVDNSTAGGIIDITDTSVSGSLNSIYISWGNDVARLGGVIAQIGTAYLADTSAVTGKLTVNLNNLCINGMQILDDNRWGSDGSYDCGGVIGYQWKNVEVLAEGIFVNKSGDIVSGIVVDQHKGGATYGGLWNKVCGHMSLKDVAINALNINISNGNAQYKNGLLVGNGQYLYLELDNYRLGSLSGVADSITSGDITDDGTNVTISDAGAMYVDEIVGYTKGTTDNIHADANTGGVISIKETTEYKLYHNKVVEQKNPFTRYYYNLSEDLSDVSKLSNGSVTIATAKQLLQWSLAHHANEPLRQFFNIEESYLESGENVTFTGTIDLEDMSYYPVSVTGGSYIGTDDAQLIFHGKAFDQYVTDWKSGNGGKEAKLKYTYEYVSEHYLLHSGLFYNVTQSTIDGITLSGSVSAVESTAGNGVMYSGALIAGVINGVELATEEGSEYINYDGIPTTITNIVLDHLSVSHVKEDGWFSNYGLMIARIGSGAKVHIGPEDTTSDIAGVKMINYNAVTDKVAAALIGQVGHEEAQGINLTFLNMQIADVADTVSDAGTVARDGISDSDEKMNLSGAKVLAHASFIYNYEYKLDNTTGVYIFYLDDYESQNVTLGEEIGSTVQFYDEGLVQSILDYTSDSAYEGLVYNPENYKPYVYQTKEIAVNPKNGNIVKGCGTYGDPYIIETSNQLMSLYYYLLDRDRYKNTLKDWEINAFGTDVVENGSPDTTEHTTHETKYYNIGIAKDANDVESNAISTYESLVEEGFPSVEQLSNAYYMITKDIDLTLEEDFSGFGTEELPFTGVFVGNALNSEQTQIPDKQVEILMAPTSSDGALRYGFIKYAKGAVVRNLHFNLGEEFVLIDYAGVGSGVMAYVIGGDNIIDTVKVTGTIKALSANKDTYAGSYSNVGAYVGNLQKGAVLLRGYTAECLSDFAINRQGADLEGAGAYQNGMVGKLQDGYVIDDTDTDIAAIYAANPAKLITKTTAEASLNATDTMNVVDLDNSCNLQGTITDSIAVLNGSDKITLSQDETNGYQYGLDSAQDILVLSFALNSGAMNYAGNTYLGNTSAELEADIYGYDRFSRCRTSDYSYVGNAAANEISKSAYLNAIKYDNGNVYTNDDNTEYVCAGNTYGTSFYRPYIFRYFDFSGDVEILRGTEYTSIHSQNQFITDTASQAKYISTYNLATGEYDMSAKNIKKCFKGIGARENYDSGKNTMYCSIQGHFKGAGSDVLHAGGAVTNITLDLDIAKYQDAALFNNLYKGTENDFYPYEISGFNLKGNVVNTYNNGYVTASGIAPRVYGSYRFSDVYISGMTITSLNEHTAGTNPYNAAAGFIVRSDYHMSSSQNNTVTFTDCRVGNQSLINGLDECGGFIAINESNGKGNTFTNCTVADTNVITLRGNVGGFVGSTNYKITFTDCQLVSSLITFRNLVEGNFESTSKGTGGYVGLFKASSDQDRAEFEDCLIEQEDGKTMGVCVEYYNTYQRNKRCGGYVGVSQGRAIFNNCDIAGLNMIQNTPSDVGGFVGYTEQILSINEAENAASEVSDVHITRSFLGSTGGILGYSYLWYWDSTDSTRIKNVNITGLQISQGWEGDNNIGGVVGHQASGPMEITNVHVLGTKEQPTELKFRIANTTSDVKLCAGGIVGKSSNAGNNTTTLMLDNCSFKGVADDSGEYYAEIINSRYSGGLVAWYTNKNAVLIKNCNVENAAIQAVHTYSGSTSIKVPHGAGSAIMAVIDNGSQTEAGGVSVENTVISNVMMKNYDMKLSELEEDWTGTALEARKEYYAYTQNKTIVFGGIAGVSRKTLNVKDFQISGLDIGEDGYAGEAGSIVGMMVSAPLNISKSDIGSNQVSDSKIIAGVAGGLVGNTQREYTSSAGAPVSISDVTLEAVTVQAKYLYGNTWELFAGGVTGRHEITDTYSSSTAPDNPDVHQYEHITIKDSIVSSYRNHTVSSDCSKTYIGGLAGGVLDCEVRGYDVSQENVLIGHMKFSDTTVQDVVPTYDNVKAGTTRLYITKTTHNDSALSYAQEELTAGTHCNHADKSYVANMGTWIGRYKNACDSYVLKAKVQHGEGLEQFHPAIDVGVHSNNMAELLTEAAGSTEDSMSPMGAAYETYNDNIHILYQEEISRTVTNGTLLADKLGLSDYYFAQLDSIYNTKFANQTIDSNCDYRLDYNYKQFNTDKTENYMVKYVFESSYKTENGYLSPYEWNGEKIPMLVSAGKYDINTVINTAINIMTNNGGATNGLYATASEASDGKLLDVTIERVQYQAENTEAPFTIIDDGKQVITYNEGDGRFNISATDYDSIEEGTFNLITVSYLHTDEHVYTLQIPVFVRETVRIITHMKGIAGSGYQLGDVQKTATEAESSMGYSQVNVELNSTYTLYSEFIYSSARAEYAAIELEKCIYRTYENSTKIHPFDVGTKITLLDLTNNNMVYFYEVTPENQKLNDGRVMFDEFKAMDNTGYTTKDISNLEEYPAVDSYLDVCNQGGTPHTEVGLEQFLIIVDESNVNATTSTIYNLYVRAEEEDNVDLFKNAAYTTPCYVKINEIPKLHKMISGSNIYQSTDADCLSQLTGSTDTVIAEGSKISRDGTLGITGTGYILSPSTIDQSLPNYWHFAATSNRSQYLEFAISIEDNLGNRITVPDGTMVTIRIDGLDYGTVVANDSEYIYCYYNTQSGKPNPSYFDLNTCTQHVAVDFEVLFNFSSSTNFTEIEDTNYHVTVELLDTPDANYPRNGEVCDSVTRGPVEGINKRNLGFTLETEDILILGMNAYNSESSDRGRIAFKSRLDFSDYMDAGEDGLGLLKKYYKDKYITYTFVLERKNLERKYEFFGYEPDSRYESLIKIVSGQALEDLEEVPQSQETDTEKQVLVSRTVKYNMDVAKSVDDEPIDGEISRANPIMEEEYTLFVDVEELLNTPANITNYKVTCYVTVSDAIPEETGNLDVTALQEASKTNDFYVFTVAKLKTDMD